MNATELNGIKTYDFSAKKYRKDRRIELIQDFNFPQVSTCIQLSPDGRYLFVGGTYKPQIKMFDLEELSMKFNRNLDSDMIQVEFLSSDYSKLVMLRNDRKLEFHDQGGRFHEMTTPGQGLDMCYHPSHCELYIVGAGSAVNRLNLEKGQYCSQMGTGMKGISCCDINPQHHLLAFGGTHGTVEFWDPRDQSRCSSLEFESGVSALKYDPENPLRITMGNIDGECRVYDLRSIKPLMKMNHRNEAKIHSIEYHREANKIITSDTRSIKIWDVKTKEIWTSVLPRPKLNDISLAGNSGVIFGATEQKDMLLYYIPALGPAPKWCSYLDTLTEELEEKNLDTIYQEYKFLTREELATMGLSHLIGTFHLKSHLHGFLMNHKTYLKVKQALIPEEQLSVEAHELEIRKRKGRITKPKKLLKKRKKAVVEVDHSEADKEAEKKLTQMIEEDPRFAQSSVAWSKFKKLKKGEDGV